MRERSHRQKLENSKTHFSLVPSTLRPSGHRLGPGADVRPRERAHLQVHRCYRGPCWANCIHVWLHVPHAPCRLRYGS